MLKIKTNNISWCTRGISTMKSTKESKQLLKTKQDILLSTEDFNKLQEVLNEPAKKSNKMIDLLSRKVPWEE